HCRPLRRGVGCGGVWWWGARRRGWRRRGESGVEAVEPARNDGRLGAAVDVDGLVDGELVAARDLGDVGDRRGAAHAGSDLDGRDEANLLEAVVDLGAHAGEVEELAPELHRERE